MTATLNKKTTDFSILIWICTLTIMVLLIIVIGGLTRLTDSGLSMVDWRPILGIIPPLSEASWQNVFEQYKLSPEYIIVNKNMTLEDFKFIFWWEWFHRFFARLIGFVFIIPFFYFLFKKRLSVKLLMVLGIIFLFGCLQAYVGWWMVKSGLTENPYVSAYRLAFHLTNALIIYVLFFWLSLNLFFGRMQKNNISKINKHFFHFSLLLIFITIVSGSFMAGTDSGKSFNTFPLMNGQIIPEGYFIDFFGWRNVFENTIAINFNHRWLAIFTFFFTSLHIIYLINKKIYNNFSLYLVLFILSLQILLGVLTLIYIVPISYASMHQTNAIILLSSMLYAYHRIIYK
ncbi:MAG: Heme A synthase [Alphaproteobacteria bacterium MarineAlpha5_Bin9]|nr:MAG: Heme A synthase [Alphaproteobacteria bacterium MarineAlpha5_Bin9]|tara:strand:- start:6700 stop:7731 length:1032 start_codon:yes stop_codon:yes gene_type:complete